jgi:hypothetical protein
VTAGFLAFPALALLYAVLLWRGWRRGRGRAEGGDAAVFVATMGALSLMVLYGVAVTSMGSYMFYPRLRTPFAPLLIAVVYGSLAAAIPALVRIARARLAPRDPARRAESRLP